MALEPLVVDLSHHDKVTSWTDVYASGIRGVIHKATQGVSFFDNMYEKRKAAATKAGLLWGAYHFGTDADVEDQVTHFLDFIKFTPDMLIALDYEPNNGALMSYSQCLEWLKLAYEKTNQRPVLYSGNLIKEQNTEKHKDFLSQHRLWLAQYGKKAVMPDAWDDYWLWQYTGDGVGQQPHSVDGIDGDELDLNVFNGSEDELKAQWASMAVVAQDSKDDQTSNHDDQKQSDDSSEDDEIQCEVEDEEPNPVSDSVSSDKNKKPRRSRCP